MARAHTLLGVAVAFDILFHYLHDFERHDLPKRIQEETTYLQRRAANKAAWNRQYIHNHMMTIQTALLAGALVSEKHAMAPSMEQQAIARLHMERILELLRHVTDGSTDEGVGYTSYSTRSLFLYIYLAKRHYRVSHVDHPWLKRHFSYLLATTLPAFNASVGIGDSSPTWFFGPEAQLYFLDKYVVGTGQANWLAGRMREARLRNSPDHQLMPSEWSMLPFEFLWYAAQIASIPPAAEEITNVRVCEDWGVATFQSSLEQNSSFLSMKSGYVLGRGLHQLATQRSKYKHRYAFVNGLSSFNGGHEHPDQGSFVFYPNGRPFITEGFYYKPKLPHMDNTWLFRMEDNPSMGPSCSGGSLYGQLGACDNWYRWQLDEMNAMSADLVMAESDLGMAAMMSESVGAYPSALGLASVNRVAVLLNSNTLLVLDTIRKLPDSPITRGNAFFNNMYEPFQVEFQDAKQSSSAESGHTIQWLMDMDHATAASTGQTPSKNVKHKRGNRDEGFYLNVSVPLLMDDTYVAWLLTSGGGSAPEMEFQHSSSVGAALTVKDGHQPPYVVSIVTNHSCVSCRFAWHGSGLLVHTSQGNKMVRFGAASHQAKSKLDVDLRPMKRMLPDAIDQQLFIYICITIICWSLLCFLLFRRFPVLRDPRCVWPIIGCILCWVIALIVMMFTTIVSQLPDTLQVRVVGPLEPNYEDFAYFGSHPVATSKPRVLLTGLPAGHFGTTLASHIFTKSPDTVFVSFADLPINDGTMSSPLAACLWENDDSNFFRSHAKSWLQQVYEHTLPVVKHTIDEDHSHNKTQKLAGSYSKLTADPSAVVVGGDGDGSWLLKVRWFLGAVHSPRILLFVQDPRHWIGGVMLRGSLFASSHLSLKEQITRVLGHDSSSCDVQTPCARTFELARQMALSENKRGKRSVHKILATMWLAYTNAMLCLAENNKNIHIVPTERFASDPIGAAKDIFYFLELPFRPSVSHHLQLVTQSGLKEYANLAEEIDGSKQLSALDSKSIIDIVNICSSTMEQLGYHPRFARKV